MERKDVKLRTGVQGSCASANGSLDMHGSLSNDECEAILYYPKDLQSEVLPTARNITALQLPARSVHADCLSTFLSQVHVSASNTTRLGAGLPRP